MSTWTSTNPISVGDPTKKTHYDKVFDNCLYLAPARHSTADESNTYCGWASTVRWEAVSGGSTVMIIGTSAYNHQGTEVQVVTSATGVTFSGLSPNKFYTLHWRLRMDESDTGAIVKLYMRFNSNTGAKYYVLRNYTYKSTAVDPTHWSSGGSGYAYVELGRHRYQVGRLTLNSAAMFPQNVTGNFESMGFMATASHSQMTGGFHFSPGSTFADFSSVTLWPSCGVIGRGTFALMETYGSTS